MKYLFFMKTNNPLKIFMNIVLLLQITKLRFNTIHFFALFIYIASCFTVIIKKKGSY